MSARHPESQIAISTANLSESRSIGHFSLGLRLEDIPAPEACPSDKGRMQREFVEVNSRYSAVEISGEVPGYGCMECPLKVHDPRIGLDILRAEAKILLQLGQKALAVQALRELRFQRKYLPTPKASIQ